MRFDEEMGALVQIMLLLDAEFAAAAPGARSEIRDRLEEAQERASQLVTEAYGEPSRTHRHLSSAVSETL